MATLPTPILPTQADNRLAPEWLQAAVLQRKLGLAKVASERADADLATASTDAAQARARYETIQAEILGHKAAA